ncbi:STAS domain-containing protein [Marinihelvus fidelis]|uniref:Anti-sigma factor antagonist n=1 Tax=Marinihelvus fidelis TaxID=2613842 RepID=A0A5N0TC24_9GAMM|nr:STAS domain-containing protein [Marinihelvus fidelis]KAA9132633.1 STAS domain-containing protein [Marinihelvus fidelis]
MSLEVIYDDGPVKATLKLIGKLDTDSAPQLTPVIGDIASAPPSVLVMDLQDLNYISSAGLRCVFQLKKALKPHGGQLVISHPSPQVKKVFDIVKAVPVQSVFSSTAELDAYLDKMQRSVGQDD